MKKYHLKRGKRDADADNKDENKDEETVDDTDLKKDSVLFTKPSLNYRDFLNSIVKDDDADQLEKFVDSIQRGVDFDPSRKIVGCDYLSVTTICQDAASFAAVCLSPHCLNYAIEIVIVLNALSISETVPGELDSLGNYLTYGKSEAGGGDFAVEPGNTGPLTTLCMISIENDVDNKAPGILDEFLEAILEHVEFDALHSIVSNIVASGIPLPNFNTAKVLYERDLISKQALVDSLKTCAKYQLDKLDLDASDFEEVFDMLPYDDGFRKDFIKLMLSGAATPQIFDELLEKIMSVFQSSIVIDETAIMQVIVSHINHFPARRPVFEHIVNLLNEKDSLLDRFGELSLHGHEVYSSNSTAIEGGHDPYFGHKSHDTPGPTLLIRVCENTKLSDEDAAFIFGKIMENVPESYVNYATADGESALIAAAINNKLDFCKALIEKGADLFLKKGQWNALDWAVQYGHENVAKFLIPELRGAVSAHLGVPSANNDALLHRAASEGHAGMLKILIDLEWWGEKYDVAGNSPLQCACIYGHLECVKILVDLKLNDVRHRNFNGDTAVGLAAAHGHSEVAIYLIEHTESGEELLNSKNNDDLFVLDCAIRNYRISTIEDLISLYPNALISPLVAVSNNSVDIVRILAYNMKFDNDEELGTKCMQAAVEKGYPDVIEVLFECGVSLYGHLKYAIKMGQMLSLHKLLELGGNPTETVLLTIDDAAPQRVSLLHYDQIKRETFAMIVSGTDASHAIKAALERAMEKWQAVPSLVEFASWKMKSMRYGQYGIEKYGLYEGDVMAELPSHMSNSGLFKDWGSKIFQAPTDTDTIDYGIGAIRLDNAADGDAYATIALSETATPVLVRESDDKDVHRGGSSSTSASASRRRLKGRGKGKGKGKGKKRLSQNPSPGFQVNFDFGSANSAQGGVDGDPDGGLTASFGQLSMSSSPSPSGIDVGESKGAKKALAFDFMAGSSTSNSVESGFIQFGASSSSK